MAARNIEGLDVCPRWAPNVYDILKRDTLVITKAGLEALEQRPSQWTPAPERPRTLRRDPQADHHPRKTTMASENGAVVFEVAIDANKPQIKQAVEELFGVKVKAVNTTITKGKTKRFRGQMGPPEGRQEGLRDPRRGQHH